MSFDSLIEYMTVRPGWPDSDAARRAAPAVALGAVDPECPTKPNGIDNRVPCHVRIEPSTNDGTDDMQTLHLYIGAFTCVFTGSPAYIASVIRDLAPGASMYTVEDAQ